MARAVSQEIYNVEIPHTSLGPGDSLARKVSIAKAIETTDKVICTTLTDIDDTDSPAPDQLQ